MNMLLKKFIPCAPTWVGSYRKRMLLDENPSVDDDATNLTRLFCASIKKAEAIDHRKQNHTESSRKNKPLCKQKSHHLLILSLWVFVKVKKLINWAMDIDLPTEIGPTKETVEALMEYLVGPLLPLKQTDITKKSLSEAQQISVAKQVHAAAVLYNYYHLNQHRDHEFLKFDLLQPGYYVQTKYTALYEIHESIRPTHFNRP